MIVFYEASFIIGLLVAGFLILVGSATALIDFISSNIEWFIFFAVVILLIAIISVSKVYKNVLLSIGVFIYVVQFDLMLILGLYNVGLYSIEHPIFGIVLFLIYTLYISYNFLGLLFPFEQEFEVKTNIWYFYILSALGWLINGLVLF